jgi:hypothetical protein
MAKDGLYCGLQFSETTTFYPGCGRPTKSGFKIRPMQVLTPMYNWLMVAFGESVKGRVFPDHFLNPC